ncbi:MAG TPA: hypothetical protein VLH10_06325 [Yinghuangia sp.]|nr:hypothetical protein [Yinghuangia sp.]
MDASEIRDSAGDFIDTETRRGIGTFDEVVAATVAHLGEAAEADEVRPVVAEAFAAHLEEQRTWPDLLDSDRVHRAFRLLEIDGIIARTDFMCCRNCGVGAIEEQVAREGRRAHGYTFFHAQDAVTAVHGGGVELCFGALAHSPELTGQAIVTRLRETGLRVDWSGDPGERIFVGAKWQRRRLGARADFPGGPVRTSAPLLVTRCDYSREDGYEDDVPMTLAECRGALYELPPVELSFVGAETTVDGVATRLATYWRIEDGRARLWSEVFHPGQFDHAGRYVSLDEIDRVLEAFAVQRRVVLGELGELTAQF